MYFACCRHCHVIMCTIMYLHSCGINFLLTSTERCTRNLETGYFCHFIITIFSQFFLSVLNTWNGHLEAIILITFSLKNIVFSRNSERNATKPMILFKKNEQQKRIKTRKELIQRGVERVTTVKAEKLLFFFLSFC